MPLPAVVELLDRCRDLIGAASVVVDPDVTAAHCVDWTGRWRGRTPAVLRPRSIADVAAIVGLAREHHVALVPQGGNTGLVGGSVPHAGEVVVDLRRLDRLDPVDREAQQVTVGAGVALAALQAHVRACGLEPSVDLGARDSATVGGMVATNAGGIHVLRHGTMRARVLGIEAVLGTADVVRQNMGGLLKDNTGYDLAGLLCGSEGTLGIVTAVRLGLVPVTPNRVVCLLGLPSVTACLEALDTFRRCPSLNAAELMLESGLRAVALHLGTAPPLEPVPPCALLVELAGQGDVMDELALALKAVDAASLGTAVADDDATMARLWRWREAHPEAAASMGLVHKADITVPLGAAAGFVEEVGTLVDEVAPGATTIVYGHLGDGNLHVNIVGPAADDDAALDAVLELVLRHSGSVSAEHGIGVAKRAWLERQRGTAAVEAMRAIKAALDPDGILNPGVLLPPVDRAGERYH